MHPGLPASYCLAEGKQQRQVGVDAPVFQAPGRFNAFPGGGDLDQHAINVYALGLIQLNDAFTPGEGGVAVKAQARIHLGRDPAGHSCQNLAAKSHQQAIHDFIQCAAFEFADHAGHQWLVVRLLHRLQDQRRIGGGILRFELRQLLEVARIGNDGGELLERIELVHGSDYRS